MSVTGEMVEDYFQQHTCSCVDHDANLCVPARSYKLDERGLGPFLLDKMRENKSRIAQIECSTGKEETFGDFMTRCIRTAQRMQSLEVTSEHVISVCTYNNMDCYVPVIAAFMLNVRVAPLDPTLSLSDLEIMLKMVNPRFIFCDEAGSLLIEKANNVFNTTFEIVSFDPCEKYRSFSEFLESTGCEDKFEAVAVNSLRDTATIIFSSGTTGSPKGICQSHFSYMYTLHEYMSPFTWLYITRLFWIGGVVLALTGISSGLPCFIINESDKDRLVEIVKDFKVDYITISPFYAYKMREKAWQYATTLDIKACFIVGDFFGKDIVSDFRKFCPNAYVTSAYGMTETLGRMTGFDLRSPRDVVFVDQKLTSVGRALSGCCVKVVDVETNEVLGPNKPGEILVKSVCIMNGYYKNEKATADTFDEDGYFRTGDYGYYDEDYCFYIIDRLKTIFKFRGWAISTSELENVLRTHPDVAEAGVIGIPHEEDGHHFMAIVTLRSGSTITENEISTYVDGRVPDVKRLRGGVRIVDHLPRTPSSKVQKKILHDMFIP